MLTELRIRNFAVIEEAALAFGPGLNVLSGETGAGKTILMTALGLLLGGRASPDLIRTSAKEAVVEGLFEFEGEAPPPGAEEWRNEENPRELIVRRVIAENGRTRVTLNDNLATVQALARIGAPLVQIYGQHEQQALLQRENHLAILDSHAGLGSALASYAGQYEQVRQLDARRAELDRLERERADLLDAARYRLTELERAELVAGEDETLTAERLLLANATRLAEAVEAVDLMLYTGDSAVAAAVAKAQARLVDAAALDPRLKEPLELLGAARANLEEAAHSIRGYADRLEADPARLEHVESRLNELIRLKRKYGGTLETAIAAREDSRRAIGELQTIGENRAALDAEFKHVLATLATAAHQLSEQRAHSAAELARRMNTELKSLAMRSAVFEPRLSRLTPEAGALLHSGLVLGPLGCDAVEFYLAPNLGQPPMPLARVASGGELSRVMLALKRLEAQRRGVATLIFDEVDAGIGGAVAEIVGRKLKQLARFHQILCVTHLAQIAAFGDAHFMIEKEERKGATRSRVLTLAPEDRPAEIARMLGGDETNDKYLRAARELLDQAST
jgi:DNA repair protein RecN (Recombination protein N)